MFGMNTLDSFIYNNSQVTIFVAKFYIQKNLFILNLYS